MSGLGWPGRGRRGAHGGTTIGGLGWPGRKSAPGVPPVVAASGRVDPAPVDPAPVSTAPGNLLDPDSPAAGSPPSGPPVSDHSASDQTASSPAASDPASSSPTAVTTALPAAPPTELRTGPAAPIAPVVLTAPVQQMQAIDSLFADHDVADRLVIELPTGDGMVRLRSRKHGVEWSEELAVAVDELLGRDRVRAVTLLAS